MIEYTDEQHDSLIRGHRRQLADAQATVEALQRERDEVSRKYHEAMDIMSAWKNIDHAEAVARLLEANKALDAEREKVKGQSQRAEYAEGKVRELLLKQDALELKLSQLQALVRALPNIEGEIMVSESLVLAEEPDMCSDMSDKREAEAYAALLRYRATLDATPTEEAT